MQNGVPGGIVQTLGNGVAAGGTFLYKFKVNRAGLFWYHPHHGSSINRVFRGLYGLIVVTDPLEANLLPGGAPPHGTLPGATDTMQLVLSDIAVCKGVGSTDPTYVRNYVDPTTIAPADRPEWLSGATAQLGPTPQQLCEVPTATKDDGTAAVVSYGLNDVPSLAMTTGGRMTEGQTVLTNGVNVGGRAGTPAAPRPLPLASLTKDINSGQGLRLQIVNCSHLRYFRLRLTTEAGANVDLVRVGGEGGLLDKAITEGGTIGTLVTGFELGEIVLPPGGRADVVAAIPAVGVPVGSVLTLWTRDYQRTGGTNPGNWAELPTVPVMHLKVIGAVAPYTIADGTALRAAAGMPAVLQLGAADGNLFVPAGKFGSSNQDIQFQTGGTPHIDGGVTAPIMKQFMGSTPLIASYCASLGTAALVGQNNLLCVPQDAELTSIFQY